MDVRTLHRSFGAGELTPELFGRVDFAKFEQGLAQARNVITLPHGPAANRTGTEFVSEVADSTKATRVIKFSYNSVQVFAIEVGEGYFRFHTQGATLLYSTPAAWSNATAYAVGDMASSGGVNYYCVQAHTNHVPPNASYWHAMPTSPNIYEIASPYLATEVMDIHYTQSSDVITIVHPNHPVLELRRYGATNWQIAYPVFSAPACPLTGVTATATTGTGATTYDYVVTAVLAQGLQETVASTHATVTNDLTVSPNKNTVTWTDPSPGGTNVRYNVYKLANGIYGFIGQSGGTSFIDQNITADVGQSPPINDTGFNDATGNYPAAVSYYEQRRTFGGTSNKPQNLWMTRSGTEADMSYTIPVRDDNRIAVKIAAREASAIRHIVPVQMMLLFTANIEWRVTSINSDALTPATFNVKPQSYHGANNVNPLVVGNLVLFASALGGHLREMSYVWQANSYVANDVSLLAPHLFDYNTIVDMAFSRAPFPIVWAVSSNGHLLGMTYVPEQQIAAWHHHDTGNGDAFESCCTISESNEDMLYVVVRRTINGATKRYIERLHTRQYTTLAEAFYVDCGITYSGAPTNTVSGLTWLEGTTVSILADGAVCPPQVVTGGTIALPVGVTASKITVGLPITADWQTMPTAVQVDPAMAQGRPKNVNKVWMRVYRSSGVFIGPSVDTLVEYKQRTTEPYGSPPALISDEIEVVLESEWGTSGQVWVRQVDPLPLDITSMTLEVAMGG